jgi:alcohol dehydrogenase YqhD (iron-dependent ADH family)
MHNFVYHNPTKVIFGKATIPQTGKETAAYGARVLLLYGCHSAQSNGILQSVITSLEEAGCSVTEHGGIRPNPSLADVHVAIQRAKEENIEVICAVGGGSVIDAAKATSVGACVEHDVWKFFTGKKSIRQKLPLIAVSTLAASGSEMNSGMVLTNDDTQQKFGFGHRLLHPEVAIMDPETTFTVPANYTAYGAIDALAHILEFYMTTEQEGTNVQDRYMEGLAMSIMESCNHALLDSVNYQARASLMWSAALALNGLSAAGLGKVGFPMHLIEHSISALYGVPHGAGLSVVIPGWLQYQAGINSTRMCQFFRRVFDIKQLNEEETVKHGISVLTGWFKHSGAPVTLQGLGIDPKEIKRLATNALPQAKIWRMREYTQERIEIILKLCIEGNS